MGLNRPINSRSAVAHTDACDPEHFRHSQEQAAKMVYEWEPHEALINPGAAKKAFGLDLKSLDLPPGMTWVMKMSPLNPKYLTIKQSVFQKIAAFVEKFKGVGGEI